VTSDIRIKPLKVFKTTFYLFSISLYVLDKEYGSYKIPKKVKKKAAKFRGHLHSAHFDVRH